MRDAFDMPQAEASLRRVPLFAGLEADQLARVAAACKEVTLEKGDVLCRAGDPGDRLFVLGSGELEVWGGAGAATLVARLQAGELVGELSVMLGERRTATVRASRRARLLALDRSGFETLLLNHPAIMVNLSRLVARRLATLARGEVATLQATSLVVTAEAGLRGKTLVAHTVAALLASFSGRASVVVDVGSSGAGRVPLEDLADAALERVLGKLCTRGPVPVLRVAVGSTTGASALEAGLGDLVARLGERFPWVLLDPDAHPVIVDAVREVAHRELAIVAASAEAAPAAAERRRLEIVNLYNPTSARVAVNQCEPFVLPLVEGHQGDATALVRLACRDRFAPLARPLHRLTRKLLGATVGIALGGGAAFGIAHVGVLKVLDDADIPVDLIAGTSMGSIIGAGYATGMCPDEMIEIAHRIGTPGTTLSVAFDPTLSRPALLSGEKMARIFAQVAGEAVRQTFEDLQTPYRAVAADVETGERVAIGDGSIETAYRASAAVPLIWSPVRWNGRVLIDGSMVDPVPGEVVREMGADLLVAVNVVPQLRSGVRTVLARWYDRMNRLNPLAYLGGSQGMPSMFDIGMNTIQMLQYELGNFKVIGADVGINPELQEFTWIEFYRARELIERGAAAAERALPDLRRVLGERLGARV